MPEPAAVWGVHVVDGAVTAALVRPNGSGGYEIIEAIAERTPAGAAEALRHARAVLSRRGVADRGASVALPDTNGCLVTAAIPPDELDMSEHEISNEMYDWTPFEPDQAELRHLCVLREGRRQERLVAALPRADYRQFLEILETGDASRLGVCFGGASTWRGARALGLVPRGGFLVTTLPHITEVYAAPGGRARRHLLALGEADLTRDATAVDMLAKDLAQIADYHRSLHRGDDKPPAEPSFVLAGLSATSPAVRQRLAAVLGPRLVDGTGDGGTVAAAAKARLPQVPLAALAGAVGAALEALRPVDERLVLRHVPANLPPYRERSRAIYVAGIALALVASGLLFEYFHDANVPPVRTNPRRAAPEQAARPAEKVPEEKLPPPPPADTAPAEPAVAATRSLTAELAGPARVRVRCPIGDDGRVIRRRYLGRDGDRPEDADTEVQRVDKYGADFVDDVPGPAGVYVWTCEGHAEAKVLVDFRVDVELVGPGDAGGARFSLRRPWREATASLVVDVAPGARVAGDDGVLAFDSGWRLDAVRTRTESERAAVRVPHFLADGRIERGEDGAPVTGERVVERERRIFEADAVGPDGSRHTWLRKMTDG
jgi:hypothetical protein